MAKLRLDISTSLDGFVAGPNPTLEKPLGEGGDLLHEWLTRSAGWRAAHGLEGGEPGPDDEIVAESLASQGAVIMGRRMFSGGEGPWADDPNADSWFGDDPPFHVPVFILTHQARKAESKQGGTSYTFVTDGIEPALEQAKAAAGDKDVVLAGGASVAQQYLKAGLVDEAQIHISHVLLGGGTHLFDALGIDPLEVETTRVVASPSVTHIRFELPR